MNVTAIIVCDVLSVTSQSYLACAVVETGLRQSSNVPTSFAMAALLQRYAIEDACLQYKLYILALQQYDASLRYLMAVTEKKELSPRNKEGILTANLPFGMLALLRGDMTDAYTVISQGLALFSGWNL